MALLVCGLGCSAESSDGDAPAADGTFSSGLLKVSTVYADLEELLASEDDEGDS